jgi:hypothetical protein
VRNRHLIVEALCDVGAGCSIVVDETDTMLDGHPTIAIAYVELKRQKCGPVNRFTLGDETQVAEEGPIRHPVSS